MSVGNGPIVSIAIRVIGDTVDNTNRGALITVCNGIIFCQVGQHCMKSRTSCKNVGQKSLEVFSGYDLNRFKIF